MIYTKQLPRLSKLQRLLKLVTIFPATAQQFIDSAKRAGYEQAIIDFLHLFHPDEVFKTRTEFITRCDELELLIEEERHAPFEVIRSHEC